MNSVRKNRLYQQMKPPLTTFKQP